MARFLELAIEFAINMSDILRNRQNGDKANGAAPWYGHRPSSLTFDFAMSSDGEVCSVREDRMK
ncbi:hypothetical protein [Paludisphaera borealis]|uniref:hypothetical protein n=1 Tax=Paludisphaera borealis TaxID=1387353 RepID=UPI001AEFA593|nr:hypothetical protein [Paludisphaera borealis]